MKTRIKGIATITGTVCVKILGVKIKTNKFKQEIPFDDIIEVKEAVKNG